MKKIMFNDRFGLTDAVLKGTKIVTRRIVTPQPTYSDMTGINWKGYAYGIGSYNPTDAYRNFITGTKYSKSCNRYRVGDVVAIAQCYQNVLSRRVFDKKELEYMFGSEGFLNKMFVKAEFMPHQIEILDVRIERMQDITDEDCIREGITADEDNYFFRYDPNGDYIFGTPREAFAELIDKVGKKGTWNSNPYVFRYEFKLK